MDDCRLRPQLHRHPTATLGCLPISVSRAQTEIIATLGPATDSAAMLQQLVERGVDIFRLDISHAPHDWVPFDLFEPQNTIETALKFLVMHEGLRKGSTVVSGCEGTEVKMRSDLLHSVE